MARQWSGEVRLEEKRCSDWSRNSRNASRLRSCGLCSDAASDNGGHRSTRLTAVFAACTTRAIWDVPRHELIFWRGHRNCWRGFTWYHTRLVSMNFNFWKKKKLIVFDILCPHILNIAWIIEQLNLIFFNFFGRGHKNSWGRRNYLGAMTLARHCVTLRWSLLHNMACSPPTNNRLIILSVRSIDVKKRSNKNKKRQKNVKTWLK